MQSFSIQTTQPAPLIQATLERVGKGRTRGLIVLSGEATEHSGRLADAIARQAPLASWMIVSAAGVLTEAGELEGQAAAVGMTLPGSAQFISSEHPDATFGQDFARLLNSLPGSTGCVFLGTGFGEDEWLDRVRARIDVDKHHVFGGGGLPGRPILWVEAGRVISGACAAIVLSGSTVAHLCSSSACRLLSPVGRVTRARGSVIFEIDGALALERLTECTRELQEQALVLLAWAGDTRPLALSGRTLALTPIQGVDPSRGSILVGGEVTEGTPVAFAVRDAHGARQDLDAQLRTMKNQIAGSAPGFGIYISCAGRGRSLYASPDVDVRLIGTHFPHMPLVGMHSTFEIAPLQTRLTPQIYAGVLGVFSLPS